MNAHNRTGRRPLLCLVSLAAALMTAQAARADLHDYIKKPDSAFSWKLKQKTVNAAGTLYDIEMVSQVWQGITWTHQLQVFLPKDVKPTSTLFLWNQGGKASIASMAMMMKLAEMMKAPVAFLYGIPNQPLLDGKKEDALIAETFVRYLKTGDGSWPLLFPMVKSVVRAMDALQEFARQEWKVEIRHFIVSGASKRGWTTWLTGAADRRVKAIAPLVIDTLNMQAQLPHQLKSYGKYSEMIRDYTQRGLVPMPDTPRAKKLWAMVDPWVYREKLTMPTLIINGANDPYWTVDALNLYWNDLPAAKKWILYVPNAGHNLKEKHDNGGEDNKRALHTLAAFARHHIIDNPMPKLEWRHFEEGGRFWLRVQAKSSPVEARLWVADAPTRDFRKVRWTKQPVPLVKGAILAQVDPPAAGYRAFFAEIDFRDNDIPYTLSTQIRVVEAKK
jgi:PhoPQ-activated pathogenicity-related protein